MTSGDPIAEAAAALIESQAPAEEPTTVRPLPTGQPSTLAEAGALADELVKTWAWNDAVIRRVTGR